eukprot:1960460-Prymnesium_polylepis.1
MRASQAVSPYDDANAPLSLLVYWPDSLSPVAPHPRCRSPRPRGCRSDFSRARAVAGVPPCRMEGEEPPPHGCQSHLLST